MTEPQLEQTHRLQNRLTFVVMDSSHCYMDKEGSIVRSSSWLIHCEETVMQEAPPSASVLDHSFIGLQKRVYLCFDDNQRLSGPIIYHS